MELRATFLSVLALMSANAFAVQSTYPAATTAHPNVITGSVALSSSSYSASQSAGSIQISVLRRGTAATSVQYQTSDGTAFAGADYTATSGTLRWIQGSNLTKTITIPISTTPAFVGSKTLGITLFNAANGVSITTATATITINGSNSGAGGPSTVSNLQLFNQGGPNNASNPLGNYQAISWAAATAGNYPVSYYKIYRNGLSYATTTATSYADTSAPNSNIVDLSAGSTIYSYAVSAVDTQGDEGPLAYPSVYLFDGQSTTNGNDLSYSGVTPGYTDTSGAPINGPYDIDVQWPGEGGFLPVVGPPLAQGNDGYGNDLEIGAFKYFTVDVKVTDTSYQSSELGMMTVSRIPPGDAFPYNWLNLWSYGTPVVGQWTTIKVPLSALDMGVGTFTGSISGTTLTVSSILTGTSVDAGGYVTGPGVPAGTYITGANQQSSIGTFTIAGPGINSTTSVASTTLNYQRTGLYKIGFQWFPDVTTTVYFNNLGFTTN